jgi:ubiquinone/menaquinone biosynthesis C-methylase UbiE
MKVDLVNYVLGVSDKEIERLNIQSSLFEKETIHTLNFAGIREGMRCLDLGCGIGHTSLLMSKLVGKSGSVVGLDISEDNIDICKKKLSDNINNLEFVVGDLLNDMTILKDSSFDFVYSRFLFQHLSDPRKALAQILKVTNKEGMIAVEELDHGLWLSYPPDPNLRRLRKAYLDLLKIHGSDPFIARKLYRIFLDTGLKPDVSAYSVCVRMGNHYGNIESNHNMIGILMAEVLEEKILQNKLMTKPDFDQMLKGLKEYAKDPKGLVLYALAFRLWVKNANIDI